MDGQQKAEIRAMHEERDDDREGSTNPICNVCGIQMHGTDFIVVQVNLKPEPPGELHQPRLQVMTLEEEPVDEVALLKDAEHPWTRGSAFTLPPIPWGAHWPPGPEHTRFYIVAVNDQSEVEIDGPFTAS